MKTSTYIINLFVVYSKQDETQYQRLCEITASLRPLLIEDNISLVLTHTVVVEQLDEWKTRASQYLKNADIVLLLVSKGFLSVDVAFLQKTLASLTSPDVLLSAAALPNFNWQQTNFYKWCSQYFGIFLLDELPNQNNPHQQRNRFEQSLLELVKLSIGIKQDKMLQSMLQEGNRLFKARKWLDASHSFANVIKLAPEKTENEEFEDTYEKLKICMRELHFDQLVKMGESAFQKQNYPQAAHFFERALQIKPSPKVVLFRESSLITPVPGHKLLKQQSEEDWFYESLQEAERLFKLKKWNAALEQYEEAISAYNFDFGYNLSNIHRQMKACRTECCFEEVFDLGREAYKAKNHHEAMTFFEEASSIKPDDPTAKRLFEKSKRIAKLKNLLPLAQKLSLLLFILLLVYMLSYFMGSV